MRALTIDAHGGLERLTFRSDVAAPELGGANDVRVRLTSAALNRLDLFVVGGLPGVKITPPWVLGADGTGRVESAGPEVTNVKPGDRVTLLTNKVHGSLNGADFILVGVFQTGLKELDDSHFRIQRAAAAPLLDTDRVESIALGLARDEDWASVSQIIRDKHPELDPPSFA